MKHVLTFILALVTAANCFAPVLVNSYRFGGSTTPVPLTLSVTALQYLRADSIAGADGDAVETWTDDTGNANATQATSAKKPVLKLAVYNGHACVRFDIVDDLMDHTSVSSQACWMVIKGTTWNASVAYISGGSAKGYFPDIAAFGAGPGGYDGSNLRIANSSNKIATGAIHSLLIISTKVYIDGVEVSGYRDTQTLGTTAVTRLNNRTDVEAYYNAFDLIEIAHFNGTPNSTDITNLKNWAQTQYGTP